MSNKTWFGGFFALVMTGTMALAALPSGTIAVVFVLSAAGFLAALVFLHAGLLLDGQAAVRRAERGEHAPSRVTVRGAGAQPAAPHQPQPWSGAGTGQPQAMHNSPGMTLPPGSTGA